MAQDVLAKQQLQAVLQGAGASKVMVRNAQQCFAKLWVRQLLHDHMVNTCRGSIWLWFWQCSSSTSSNRRTKQHEQRSTVHLQQATDILTAGEGFMSHLERAVWWQRHGPCAGSICGLLHLCAALCYQGRCRARLCEETIDVSQRQTVDLQIAVCQQLPELESEQAERQARLAAAAVSAITIPRGCLACIRVIQVSQLGVVKQQQMVYTCTKQACACEACKEGCERRWHITLTAYRQTSASN